MASQKRTFPLRTTLVGAVLISASFAVALTLGMIGIPAYHRAKEAMKALWQLVAQEVAQSATAQVLQYFERAPISLRMVEGLVEEEQLTIVETEAIFDVCYRTLKENPNFATVYYSTVNGSFYGVFKLGDSYIASHRTLREGEKTAIENYQIGPDQRWIFMGREEKIYDPRSRPFWSTGLKHPEGAWTEVYRFATSQALGYSYVLPQHTPTGIAGYWAVDFQLDGLSNYLSSLKIGQEGATYLVAYDGTVIAQSMPTAVLPPSIASFFGKVDWVDEGEELFYIHQFPVQSQIPWSLITMIHQDDFLLPIQKTALHSLGLGIIPFFAFLGVSAFFFGRVARRLKQMAHEMNQAGKLSIVLKEQGPPFSRVDEINSMNQSLFKMQVGLQSFSKYVPLDLVKKLILSGCPPELGGEKKEITVLFADLVRFTSFAEKMDPDEVISVLGSFLAVATEEIHKEKGIIDKFMGDAVMALWGAPEPVSNAPLAACRAALRMQKVAQKDPRMKYKIGINTGVAMVGHFGSQERVDYTAIGDSVNIAARLEKLNKLYNTQILLGPDTAKVVRDDLFIRPVDWVILEGRTQPIFIYELLGERAAPPLVEAVETYQKGLDAYRNRQFTLAAHLFEKADALFGGGDTPSKILKGRSLQFEKKPPAEPWEGTALYD